MSFKKIAVIVMAVAVCGFAQINLASSSTMNFTANQQVNCVSNTQGFTIKCPLSTQYSPLWLQAAGVSDLVLNPNGALLQGPSVTLNSTAGMTFTTGSAGSGPIAFRTSNSAANATTHYGDLTLSGGDYGTQWGWFNCNKLVCYGDLDVVSPGVKRFVQAHPTDSTKEIGYITIEAGEALTLVRGTAKTVNGAIEITLAEDFSLVTSADAPLTVLLTPKKMPVTLCVTNETKDKITVAMKYQDLRDFGDVEFCYQVTGVRDGYENYEPIRDIDPKMNIVKDDKSPATLKKKAFVEKAMKFRERKEKIMKERR